MPKYEIKPLLDSLQQDVGEMLLLVEENLLLLDDDILNYKPNLKKWSAYECVEHLNLAHKVYMKQLKEVVPSGSQPLEQEYYKSGFFGEQMVSTLKPTDAGKIKAPMPTFTKADPSKLKSSLSKAVIETFLIQLKELQAVLSQATQVSWERVKITSLIGSILRFKFGDALRFLVAHNQRHLLQAQRAIDTYRK